MNANFRPVDLPELRAEIVDRHRSRMSLVKWEELITQGERDWMDILIGRKPRRGDGVTMQAYERMRVADAELYYVSPEMTELAVTAGRSLPDFNIDREDIPSPNGLLVFGKPLEAGRFAVHLPSADLPGERAVGISAISWSVMPHGAAIWLSFYATRQNVIDSVPTDLANDLPAGQRLIYLFGLEAAWELHMGDREVTTAPHLDHAGRALRSSWLLMHQPLANVSVAQPDRAVRKRLRRAGHEAAPVRVIELRRPKNTGGKGDGDREYHHQWIVRGHWRQHWFPKREVHRPVWISPHVKGPEGAPLIGGEKVYALKR